LLIIPTYSVTADPLASLRGEPVETARNSPRKG
jgi:hypothetical protein